MDCNPSGFSVYVYFFREEYWSEFPFPPPELLDPGIEPVTPVQFPALVGVFFITEPPGKPHKYLLSTYCVPAVCKLLVMLRDLCLDLPGFCLLVVEIDHSK